MVCCFQVIGCVTDGLNTELKVCYSSCNPNNQLLLGIWIKNKEKFEVGYSDPHCRAHFFVNTLGFWQLYWNVTIYIFLARLGLTTRTTDLATTSQHVASTSGSASLLPVSMSSSTFSLSTAPFQGGPNAEVNFENIVSQRFVTFIANLGE